MKIPKKNKVEWGVFFISFLLVLSVCGYLVYSDFRSNASPPAINVKIIKVETQNRGYLMELELENTGDQTAENILIEIALTETDRTIETSEFQIAFLPRHSKRRGFVTFRTNPQAAGAIIPRVLGFEAP